ncbi:uncharacterized protein DNG_09466 [Cephalotrichum gorgonifer]|uniref:Phytanoyl-CoA hydroxylase n=1 Tax=Cephalotrichum gorgonifer TaxID=2041049 RepID=A0AAE8N5X7_9PEZI|nr:uncharacterized protein DNG_09466 [Cephalotrichum gorgonifer]
MTVPTSTPSKPTLDGVELYVNDGLLRPDEVAPLHPSSPSEPVEQLYKRYAADGYLFLRGLIPREDVLDARKSYFSALEPTLFLEPNLPVVDGIFNSSSSRDDFPGIGSGQLDLDPGSPAARFVDAAVKSHTDSWYIGSKEEGITGFCNHPAILEFVARFTGWAENTLTVRRTLLRNNTPGNHAIGVHYDQIYMRYGEPTSVTVWVPIGDVKLEGGGLIYLEEGYKIGERMEKEFNKKARADGMSEDEVRNAFNANMLSSGVLSEEPREFANTHGKKWLVAAYEAGDVVLHGAHTIHASTVNHDPEGCIRLATDLRFVDSSKPWDTRWDKDFEIGDGV